MADLLLGEMDRYPDVFDLDRAPEAFLDLIIEDLGTNPFPFDLDVLGKRRLASVLVEYRQKGTAVGIENAIRVPVPSTAS